MKRRFSLFATAALAVCMCLMLTGLVPVAASAEGEIAKVTVRTEPSNPGVLMKISDIGTTVSSNNGTVTGISWYDSAGNLDTDTVDNCVYTVHIRVTAPAGYIYSANCEGSINNALCTVARAEDGSYVELSRVIEPALVAPTIWWSPKGESANSGELVSFAATASPYYDSVAWNLISPTGTTSKMSSISDKFPGVTYSQDDSIGRLNIYNITTDMDGWKVSCTFSGPGGSATTSTATITVKDAVKATPTPSPTPNPTPTPENGSNGSTSDSNHEHEYAAAWSFDDSGHWHECSCGEKGDFSQHSFVWTELQKATKKQAGQEQGVCSVCGYESVRSVEYTKAEGSSSLLRILLYVAIGAVVLVLIWIVIQGISYRNYKRRSRRKRNRRRY